MCQRRALRSPVRLGFTIVPDANSEFAKTEQSIEAHRVGPDFDRAVHQPGDLLRDRVAPHGQTLAGGTGTDPAVAFKDQPQTLVDDTGRAYPLTADAITALGYSGNQGLIVPPAWLLLLPRGPLLTTPGKG